jgi:serine phosphatase RsbU (regulator of sigma subunit)
MNITNEQNEIFMTLDEQILYLDGIISVNNSYNDNYDKLILKNIKKSLEAYKRILYKTNFKEL